VLVVSIDPGAFSLLDSACTWLVRVGARALTRRVAVRLFEAVRQVQRRKSVPLLVRLVDGSLLVLICLRHFNQLAVVDVQIIYAAVIVRRRVH
jgi:hypothetical protein